MIVWLDAQVPPGLAPWLQETFGVTAMPVSEVRLSDAEDDHLFFSARQVANVLITKESGFIHLKDISPLKVLWLTCENTSEKELRRVFLLHFRKAIRLFEAGESLVEIR